MADAMLFLRLSESGSEVRAFDRYCVAAVPDVIVFVGPLRQVPKPVSLQLLGKLAVVLPVELDNLYQRVLGVPETGFNGGALAQRVPRHPKLGVPVLRSDEHTSELQSLM